MKDEASEILGAAMKLSELERARLAAILADSIGDGTPQDEIDAATLAEAKRRLADLDSGRTQAVPYPEIRQKLHATVERARRLASTG